ncbi:MAG TPA: ABC transporter permease subunit [Anaerolineae bacterium]|jgi:ABC-type transport system involved in multi-copper enzyme maturation permease subunit|nr:ABC transporter permease subunit [Anaerolineae bacterium]
MVIRAIAGNVIREAIRQKIVYVTVLFTLLLFAIEPSIPSFKVGLRIQLFQDIALGVAYIAIAILAIALTVNQVPGEVERRTIYNIFSKPVRRSDYLIGKYIGVLVVIAACALIMGFAVFGFAFAYFGKLSFGLFQGIGMTVLEAALISAFALLMSTFVSPTVNVFACILFYFVGHVKNGALTPTLESGGASHAVGLVLKYLLPSLENFNANEAIARGVMLKSDFLLEVFLYALAFSAALLVIASLSLNRKEL